MKVGGKIKFEEILGSASKECVRGIKTLETFQVGLMHFSKTNDILKKVFIHDCCKSLSSKIPSQEDSPCFMSAFIDFLPFQN